MCMLGGGGGGGGGGCTTFTILSVICVLMSSREMSSLCWTLTTTVWTLSGTQAPSSRRYSTVTCGEGGGGGGGEKVRGGRREKREGERGRERDFLFNSSTCDRHCLHTVMIFMRSNFTISDCELQSVPDLCLGIGPDPGQSPIPAVLGHQLVHLVCQYNGEWHHLLRLISGIAIHQSLMEEREGALIYIRREPL